MVEAILFIGLLIVAITQIIKTLVPQVSGVVTVVVAILVGVGVALIDQYIGVTDITIAQGVVAGLGAVGISTVANKVGER